jgi:hypothetical protein
MANAPLCATLGIVAGALTVLSVMIFRYMRNM